MDWDEITKEIVSKLTEVINEQVAEQTKDLKEAISLLEKKVEDLSVAVSKVKVSQTNPVKSAEVSNNPQTAFAQRASQPEPKKEDPKKEEPKVKRNYEYLGGQDGKGFFAFKTLDPQYFRMWNEGGVMRYELNPDEQKVNEAIRKNWTSILGPCYVTREGVSPAVCKTVQNIKSGIVKLDQGKYQVVEKCVVKFE